jgi:hypothetical protein
MFYIKFGTGAVGARSRIALWLRLPPKTVKLEYQCVCGGGGGVVKSNSSEIYLI